MPEWTRQTLADSPRAFTTLEARMAVVLHFAQLNVEKNTGGPFAAGVFEEESGKLLAIGVNRVVDSNCSSAHAEIMALTLAQQKLGHYDLGRAKMPCTQLVVSCRPCAMCLGAVIWSGVSSLVLALSGNEAEDLLNFDEGPIHPDWLTELAQRGIHVHQNVMSMEAREILQTYGAKGSLIYNARQG